MSGHPCGAVVAASSAQASKSPREPWISRLCCLDRKAALLVSFSKWLTWPRVGGTIRGNNVLSFMPELVQDRLLTIGEIGWLCSGCCRW